MMDNVKEFYNDISEYYHLIYSNWEQSIANQAKRISGIMEKNWKRTDGNILDCTCGIGTQSLGLASLGYKVVGSDLSECAIKRAQHEAQSRKLDIRFGVADVRKLPREFSNKFDFVISCDNSLPHLPNKTEFIKALRKMFTCTKNGGGVLISVRDYEKDTKEGMNLLPYGVREADGAIISVFQMRDFYRKDHYRVNLYFVYDYGNTKCITKVFRSEYYTISIKTVMELMVAVGFQNVGRIDDGYFQPVIVGTKKG